MAGQEEHIDDVIENASLLYNNFFDDYILKNKPLSSPIKIKSHDQHQNQGCHKKSNYHHHYYHQYNFQHKKLVEQVKNK